VVALKGKNDDEFIKFAKLTFTYPFHVRFIEHMPLIKTTISNGKPLLSDDVKIILSALGELTPINKGNYDGPAKRYRFKGAKGEIGFISPVSDHFCKTCNRLRLTASGNIRPCLLSDYQEDVKTPLRSGCSDDDLAKIIIKTIENKPSGHMLSFSEPVSIRMSSIGG
jgi:cyclic pyranopterin phosphate synthase